MKKPPHSQDIDTCLKALDSDSDGLSSQEAKKRLNKYGANRLPEEKIPAVWMIFLRQFMNPLIYILLIAGVVTFFMQEYPGAVFIFFVLLINAVIGTVQEYSANKAAAALKKMSAAETRVIRDDSSQKMDKTKLVPGDIVLLQSGDKVPADCRLINTSSLIVDESLLTGESKDIKKQAETTLDESTKTSDQVNMVFAGTFVTHGRARALVVATGLDTQVGKIAESISKQTEKLKAKIIMVLMI